MKSYINSWTHRVDCHYFCINTSSCLEILRQKSCCATAILIDKSVGKEHQLNIRLLLTAVQTMQAMAVLYRMNEQ